LGLNPSSSAAWYGKGAALNETGKHDEALTSYNNAIELNPSNGAAWYGKGLLLYLLGSGNESEKAIAKARELGYNSTKSEAL
jgi:tetratricopeptide (TPR) repeat protein